MGILSYGYKGAIAGGKKFFGKKSSTIKSIKPAKNLTTKRNIQDKVVKAVDEGTKKGLGGAKASDRLKQSASKMKRDESKKLKGVSYEYDRLTKKFAKTKANIEKKKKIKTVAGATAVGSGTAAAGLAFKKIRDKKMGGGMAGRRFGYKSGMSVKGDDKRDIRKVEQMIGASKSSKREKGLVGNQKKIDVAAPFGTINAKDFEKLRRKKT